MHGKNILGALTSKTIKKLKEFMGMSTLFRKNFHLRRKINNPSNEKQKWTTCTVYESQYKYKNEHLGWKFNNPTKTNLNTKNEPHQSWVWWVGGLRLEKISAKLNNSSFSFYDFLYGTEQMLAVEDRSPKMVTDDQRDKCLLHQTEDWIIFKEANFGAIEWPPKWWDDD